VSASRMTGRHRREPHQEVQIRCPDCGNVAWYSAARAHLARCGLCDPRPVRLRAVDGAGSGQRSLPLERPPLELVDGEALTASAACQQPRRRGGAA
jgi:hypothetical protein